MKARDLRFDFFPTPASARSFVVANHYSKKCPPSVLYFRATHDAATVGACCFRQPSLPKVGTAYDADIELTRLVMLDAPGKNSESRFIGHCLRWSRDTTHYRRVISYADPDQGHQGIVYRASNFLYEGPEKGHGTRLITVDGETMHAKTAYDRYGASGKNLQQILPGSVVEVTNKPPKLVYTYKL